MITRIQMFDDMQTKRKAYLRAILRAFPHQACQYTVKDIIWWADELNCMYDVVNIPSVAESPLRIWELKSSPLIHARAQHVPASWFGGPRVIKCYNGHLMQFLMDRVLMEVKAHGTKHFLEINKKFKVMKREEARIAALNNITVGHTDMYSISTVTDVNKKPIYDIKYTDVMGTSEWGGKCPFATQ